MLVGSLSMRGHTVHFVSVDVGVFVGVYVCEHTWAEHRGQTSIILWLGISYCKYSFCWSVPSIYQF